MSVGGKRGVIKTSCSVLLDFLHNVLENEKKIFRKLCTYLIGRLVN